MPASNRRPLWDDADGLSTTDTVSKQQAVAQEALPAPSAAAAAAVSDQAPAFKQPCTLKGAASATYAGALGYFLGFVPATIKFKAKQWGMIHTQGLASAQQLAVMSGMYTAVHCICQRIRMVEDGWNRGVAGCSTGLVLGWSSGPWSALQSCAGLGLISALIDLGGGLEAAEARDLQPTPLGQQQHGAKLQQSSSSSASSNIVRKLPCTQADQRRQQQEAGGDRQLLEGLPQPAQLLALLLGAHPHSLDSSAAASRAEQPGNASRMQELQQQTVQQPQWRRQQRQRPAQGNSKASTSSSSLESDALASDKGAGAALPTRQPQQLAAPVVQILQPAVDGARHLLLAAPPLVFLGACCHSSAAARAGAKAAAAGAAADIDGCPVTPPANATAAAAAAAGAVGRQRA